MVNFIEEIRDFFRDVETGEIKFPVALEGDPQEGFPLKEEDAGPVYRFLRQSGWIPDVTVGDPENLTDTEAERVRRRLRAIPRRVVAQAVRNTDTMPVEYSDWISIAFEVARQKGADFSTSRDEIRAGTAPTTEAVRTFAEIWRERKNEIVTSRARAREIARQEITVR